MDETTSLINSEINSISDKKSNYIQLIINTT